MTTERKERRRSTDVPTRLIGKLPGKGSLYTLDRDSAWESEKLACDYGLRSLALIGLEAVDYLADSHDWAGAKLCMGENISVPDAYGDCLVDFPGKPLLLARKDIALTSRLVARLKRDCGLAIEGKLRDGGEHSYDLTPEEYATLEEIAQADKVLSPDKQRVFTLNRSRIKDGLNLWDEPIDGDIGKFLFGNYAKRLKAKHGIFRFYFGERYEEDSAIILSQIYTGDYRGGTLDLGLTKLDAVGKSMPLLISKGRKHLKIKITDLYFLKYKEIAEKGYKTLEDAKMGEAEKEKLKRQEEFRTRTLEKIAGLCKKEKVSLNELSEILEPNRRECTYHTESQGDYEDRILREAYRINRDRRDDPNRSF
jgi:hypothetical protein